MLDIAVAFAFLTTCVKEPTKQDWLKLKRMIRYLQGSIDLSLTLSVDKIVVPKFWVDGSHAMRMDLKGHSGASMSLGQGSVVTGSTKQKINLSSSTETELVTADDYMPMLLWTNYFLRDQGYDCSNTILYQ